VSGGSPSIVGDSLYVVGGGVAQRSTLEANGELGAFASEGPLGAFTLVVGMNLPTGADIQNQYAVVGDRLYIVGGDIADAALTGVLSAPLHDDGSVGALEAIGTLPGARVRPAVAMVGDSLYLF
jgi:hypothetical protein